MEKAHIQRYKNMHMIHKTFPTHEHDCPADFDTQFSNWFQVVKHWWPHTHGCFVKLYSGSSIMKKLNTGSTHNIKWTPPIRVPNYGCQWTITSTYCNNRIGIRSRWHYMNRKFRSHDKPYKLLDWSSFTTTQLYNTVWNASKILKFSVLFNAIEKWKSDIVKRKSTQTKPSRNYTPTR